MERKRETRLKCCPIPKLHPQLSCCMVSTMHACLMVSWLCRRSTHLVGLLTQRAASPWQASSIQRKLKAVNLPPAKYVEALSAADRLASSFYELRGTALGEELSSMLQNLHPSCKISPLTGNVAEIRCNNCQVKLRRDIMILHVCKRRQQLAGTGFKAQEPGNNRSSCMLCGQQWPCNDHHKCPQLNRVIVDLVGLPSISNPTSKEATKLIGLLLLLPGLRCSVFPLPPTSPQRTITGKEQIVMHNHLSRGHGQGEGGCWHGCDHSHWLRSQLCPGSMDLRGFSLTLQITDIAQGHLWGLQPPMASRVGRHAKPG